MIDLMRSWLPESCRALRCLVGPDQNQECSLPLVLPEE